MNAYKQFLASDLIISPFEVNKSFTFQGANELTGSNVGIDRFQGLVTSSLFNPTTDPTTGQLSTQYQRLVYSSIKQLYYSNFTNATQSYGSPVNTASLIPGSDPSGDVLSGSISSAGRFYNYPQTSLTFPKYFPTSSNSLIGVLSIPVGLFGNFIQPGSFKWIAPSGSIYDDGEGNLIFATTGEMCGNIFYSHGLAVITSDSQPQADAYGTAVYGSSLYGTSDSEVVQNFVTSSNVTCSFSSSLTIYETQYKCTIAESEFNYSQNPTIISGNIPLSGSFYSSSINSSGSSAINTSSFYQFYQPTDSLYPFATASYFAPYVTTIGLYDEDQNLLAIGKLSQPLPTNATTDTTILVNIDR
jgi:hypothetical protein